MGLPSGVVTFLFTDIEGSTRLFQELGDDYPPLLEEHNRIIRAAVAERGVEISTEGDAFFIVFADAGDAIAAAVEAQRGLDGVVRVRMGLHCGEAHPSGHNYVALAVHQAARVAHAGHGGQIVVSQAIADAAKLADDVGLRPLGPHVLRDFPSVEALFQVTAPGLGESFPALRTPTATTNLPRPRTAFVGREAELATLSDLLDSSQLVTLTGTGGTGKTRLSIELARAVAPRFDNGVVWIDLAPRNDPALVPQAVAEALGIGEQAGRVLVHTLIDHLSTSRTLIVIDNCEHLIEATAEVVEHLLDGCEHVVVVATSREPLGVPGETVFRVPSLPTESMVELFVERVTQANRAFAPDDAARAAIATICARLDGIPLAIELAASRARSMSVHDIAARIEDRFALLSGGSRTALPRQQTLRGLVDWSYELLEDDERAVFRRIAVFNGRFPLSGVEALCGDLDVDALLIITRLVDKSLVNATDGIHGTRYQLLQTIRHYGFERLLDAGEAADARSRHRDWCAATVEALPDFETFGTADHELNKATLDELIDDIRATFDWSTSRREYEQASRLLRHVTWYYVINGLMSEARRNAEVILAGATDDPKLEALMLMQLGNLGWEQGDYAATVGYARRYLLTDASLWDDDDLNDRAGALHVLGTALWRIGELDEAEACLEEANACDDDAPAPLRALRWHNIALSRQTRGDYDGARAWIHRALAEGDGEGWEMEQLCHTRLGNIATLEQNYDEARRSFAMARSLSQNRDRLILIRHYEGDLALALERFDDAVDAYAECAASYRSFNSSNGAAHEELSIGKVALARGDFGEARRLIEVALSVFEQQGGIL